MLDGLFNLCLFWADLTYVWALGLLLPWIVLALSEQKKPFRPIWRRSMVLRL